MKENKTMELPFASDQEYKKRVVHYPVFGDKLTVSFLTMSANGYFPPHRHESEQIMVVLGGYCDEIVEGKLYRLEKGDVIMLPPNMEHGAYIREVDCVVIDIFSPPRKDFKEKFAKVIQKSKKG